MPNPKPHPCYYCNSEKLRMFGYMGKVSVACWDCSHNGPEADTIDEAVKLWNEYKETV